MIARVLSVLLRRTLAPFVFVPGRARADASGAPNLGLYVHIPFCRTLCDFCPYYKVTYDPALVEAFVAALLNEIQHAGASGPLPATSVYFGGGTPALLREHLPVIQQALHTAFDIDGPSGIELHPDDISAESGAALRDAGFDMVSIGVQSFQPRCLRALDRRQRDLPQRVDTMRKSGFSVVDVDLIFGIPGQTARDIESDFQTAVSCGATQISTYPFIDFTYAPNKRKPLGRRQKHALLDAILNVSDKLGFERTSVWTFARPGTERYWSVTRDNYLGFGPSAASLLQESFSINVFSVPEYVSAVDKGRSPAALRVDLSARERKLMWLFWHSYNLNIGRSQYAELFNGDIEQAFGLELRMAELFRIVERHGDAYTLTRKGAYLFHLVEQQYTNQYIDRVWRLSNETAWPEELVIW